MTVRLTAEGIDDGKSYDSAARNATRRQPLKRCEASHKDTQPRPSPFHERATMDQYSSRSVLMSRLFRIITTDPLRKEKCFNA
ncbi:hypothetical protein HBH56_019240 [Parastagonospora nodorum]|uniref:Uncharacterized protein n=1 Tax=Phaeosphaeria nodorum (strain SN15 / ATCC MYA-4574 / FGSC 10173) TaxID=321614 RepID=Q0UYY7_PHANO|nr:hypothetical protein SNOG_03027 [Parastagonospora nodorum SN15]KAH3919822.1 hypothetical protein HBH56_019240 [Parastagonospora nodorum]EAT89758.1 hypothetical protein SNOG_03027 [Parastagonospora nodorum SN15]KAH3953872.1 hypothetical protein HBH53_027400 [Parastagonospora nodorum]KAH3962659.1 hypothetical protein HBH51_174400 [Parastagonospora nodorum]KAH3990674.1 hypothetical protein HBH52_004130 [Parastagonospora nodorum]